MKKILLVVDGSSYSDSVFEFVRRLNELEPVLVTGVFVPQMNYANLWSYTAAAGASAVYLPFTEEIDDKLERNVHLFEEQCHRNDIRYRVHKDVYEFALPELKQESRFSDVMVLSGELFYKQIASASQFDYMKTVLHQSECPVIVVPENAQFPSSNFLAYDGSEDSVYAMKQFACIFPELAKNKTLLVYVEAEKVRDFPSRDSVEEWAPQHYPDLTFFKLEVDPGPFFSTWISEQKAALLVSGSFGRSGVSNVFHKSFIADIINDHQVPVFVAHR